MDARFPYASKAVNKVLAFVLGGGMAAFGAWSLARGAVISRRGNVLSPEFSTFIWIFVLVAGLALLAWGVRMVIAGPRTVVVTHEFLEAPRTLASRSVDRVPIAAISDVTTATDPVAGELLLVAIHGRKPLRIARNGFADAQAFSACGDAIQHARARHHG